MPAKRWRATWEGHTIEVENTWFSGERMFVDGRQVAATAGLISSTLTARLPHAGREVVVTARLTQAWLGLRVLCAIFVDGARIAGDEASTATAPSGTPAVVAPCPRCHATRAVPVGFTWWGGMLGPRLLHLVRCTACGTRYDSRTGDASASRAVVAILIAAAAAFFLLLAVIGALVYFAGRQ